MLLSIFSFRNFYNIPLHHFYLQNGKTFALSLLANSNYGAFEPK